MHTTYHQDRASILSQLDRTVKRSTSAMMSAAFGRDDTEFMKHAQEAAQEARELLISVEGLAVPVDAFMSESPYTSPNVPEGYNTVYGYMETVNPGLLDVVRQPLKVAYNREQRALRALANRRKLPLCKVVAPLALQDEGVEAVIAYPINLLREVLY